MNRLSASSFLLLCICICSVLTITEQRSAKVSAPENSNQARNYVPGLPGGFKCPVLPPSSTIPTNARSVRPADIKVVGALGDSITAANGAKATTVEGVLKQYRGLSWSAGGDADISTVLTLPNILKKYNAKLYGFSLGSGFVEDTKQAYYNVAGAGNTAVELVEQSRQLVQKITTDKKQNEWKIITSFIGGNDVCNYCYNRDLYSAANFKKNVQTAIDNLYNGLRNTIVNLASPLDMTQVSLLPNGFSCSAVHRTICGCIYNKSDTGYATRVSYMYQQKIDEIVAEAPKRWPRVDFGLSYQPQFTRVEMPTVNGAIDTSYFAPDCFHFSQKGHEAAAITLWNNMLKPVSKRQKNLQLTNRNMDCPTNEAPYIMI